MAKRYVLQQISTGLFAVEGPGQNIYFKGKTIEAAKVYRTRNGGPHTWNDAVEADRRWIEVKLIPVHNLSSPPLHWHACERNETEGSGLDC